MTQTSLMSTPTPQPALPLTSVLVAIAIDGTLFQIDASGELEKAIMEERPLETCEALALPSTMGLYVWEGDVEIDDDGDIVIYDGKFRPLSTEELALLHKSGTVFAVAK